MDYRQFDRFTRTFSTSSSRRGVVGFLAAMIFIGSRVARASAAQGDVTDAICDPGMTFCPDPAECVDLQSDLNNCGACGAICESGLVPVDCRAGECVRANCEPGLEYCGPVDLCRDLTSDPAHCGACTNACASGVCNGGVCAISERGCEAGQTDCGGVCVDTCCNNNHCGACDNVCPSGMTCFEGVCDCPSGQCPPMKLPNTGRGGTQDGSPEQWLAALMAGAAAVPALLWRNRPHVEGTRGGEKQKP